MSVTSCISGTLREMLWDGISAGDRLARQCIERLTQLELRFPYTYLTMSLGLSPGYLHSDWSGLIEARIKAEFAAAGFGEVQMTLTSLDRWSLMPKPPRARLPGLEVAVLTCSALRFPESEDEMPSFASPIEALSWCRSGSVVPAAGRHAGRVAAKPAG